MAIAAAVLVLTGGGAAAGIARADPPAPPPGPPPGPERTIDHDGTYVVGTDIAPGTYSSAGPVAGGTCYWKRMSSLNGRDIVDNAMSLKPQVVQIDPGDKAFKTDGCQPWQKTDDVNADGNAPGEMAPPSAQAQLHNDIDTLNGYARQFGGAQLPAP